jgi:hypothetical protein
LAQGTTCPTAKKREATATPISPAAASRATIEKVATLVSLGFSRAFPWSGTHSRPLTTVKLRNKTIVTVFEVNEDPDRLICMFNLHLHFISLQHKKQIFFLISCILGAGGQKKGQANFSFIYRC